MLEPVIPAMIVGQNRESTDIPLGFGEPFALLGGDRLGPGGIPFALAHEWQPEFLSAVICACEQAIEETRPWFRMTPSFLTGPAGTGRTHAARRLAKSVGVPHVILNLSDPLIAANLGSGGEIGEALWVSPVAAAMAATRVANPVVSVVGMGIHPDADATLAELIDPAIGSYFHEDMLGIDLDLGEVTWLIQIDEAKNLPPLFGLSLEEIAFKRGYGRGSEICLSVAMEVLADLQLGSEILAAQLPEILDHERNVASVSEIYSDYRNLLVENAYQTATGDHSNLVPVQEYDPFAVLTSVFTTRP